MSFPWNRMKCRKWKKLLKQKRDIASLHFSLRRTKRFLIWSRLKPDVYDNEVCSRIKHLWERLVVWAQICRCISIRERFGLVSKYVSCIFCQINLNYGVVQRRKQLWNRGVWQDALGSQKIALRWRVIVEEWVHTITLSSAAHVRTNQNQWRLKPDEKYPEKTK